MDTTKAAIHPHGHGRTRRETSGAHGVPGSGLGLFNFCQNTPTAVTAAVIPLRT
ncbi:MAG: hypothetical protein QOI07_696 [Verrucomicrobiota bacterium]